MYYLNVWIMCVHMFMRSYVHCACVTYTNCIIINYCMYVTKLRVQLFQTAYVVITFTVVIPRVFAAMRAPCMWCVWWGTGVSATRPLACRGRCGSITLPTGCSTSLSTWRLASRSRTRAWSCDRPLRIVPRWLGCRRRSGWEASTSATSSCGRMSWRQRWLPSTATSSR